MTPRNQRCGFCAYGTAFDVVNSGDIGYVMCSILCSIFQRCAVYSDIKSSNLLDLFFFHFFPSVVIMSSTVLCR